ncbi:BRO family protein [Empedobacter brevis]|uniref:BRO family protein n=1 Tax=Empedobacter brevis TaxID=247 RepID=UPI0028AC83D2|nr:BRO family protein [Empedobacter brevis]
MQLEVFKFQSPEEQMFNEIRTIEIDGEIWFVATDVAKTLGYAKPSNAINSHCKPKGTLKQGIPTSSGVQNMTIINESNVYRLIIKSQLPAAEKFEEWLFEEVVPSIRKKGYYGKIDRTQLPNFYLRYKENVHKIDRNYFSVISELFVTLNAELEKFGYEIPDKGIKGQGMYPDYLIGDLLVIRSDIEPRHNDDIIVSVNNSEYTFKRYDQVHKKLEPLNPKYKDAIHLDDEDTVLILGVVTSLIRQKRKV